MKVKNVGELVGEVDEKLVGGVDEGLVGDDDEELVGEVLQGVVHDESGLKMDDVEVNLNLVDNQVEGE